MKHIRILTLLMAALVLFSACGDPPHETTEPHSISETSESISPVTESAAETTAPIASEETTSPTSVSMPPESSILYFYAYYNDYGMSFHEYYLSPEGSDEWYQVHLDDEFCYHPIPGIAYPDQGANVRRAYIFYDGPNAARWVLKSELYVTEDIESLFGEQDYDYLEYLWSEHISITEGKTILCLGSATSEPIPSWQIEFCEHCPAYWMNPVE